MPPGRSNKKVASSLVTLSSAAILAVYAAGFIRTRAAAERLEETSNNRRPVMPAPATAGEDVSPAPIEPAPVPSAIPAPVAVASVVKKEPAPIRTPVKAKSPALAVPTPQAASPSPTPTPNSTPTPTPTPDAGAGTESSETSPVPALKMPKDHYNDGTFLGWGTSRHGDIQASVKIEGGRIVAAAIAQCWTRYSCSWVSHLPGQVVARQSADVDYVSGATQSANAFYWAIVDALTKAK